MSSMPLLALWRTRPATAGLRRFVLSGRAALIGLKNTSVVEDIGNGTSRTVERVLPRDVRQFQPGGLGSFACDVTVCRRERDSTANASEQVRGAGDQTGRGAAVLFPGTWSAPAGAARAGRRPGRGLATVVQPEERRPGSRSLLGAHLRKVRERTGRAPGGRSRRHGRAAVGRQPASA